MNPTPAPITSGEALKAEDAALLAKQVSDWRKEVARLNDLIAHATGTASAASAPVAQSERDALTDGERLEFMITEECQIEHLDLPGKAPLYRVRWPWREEQMRGWSYSGRAAIDVAIAAQQPAEGGEQSHG